MRVRVGGWWSGWGGVCVVWSDGGVGWCVWEVGGGRTGVGGGGGGVRVGGRETLTRSFEYVPSRCLSQCSGVAARVAPRFGDTRDGDARGAEVLDAR